MSSLPPPEDRKPIYKGQIWKSIKGDAQFEVVRQEGVKWQMRKLTHRTGVYHGTHTMHARTIWANYELIKD